MAFSNVEKATIWTGIFTLVAAVMTFTFNNGQQTTNNISDSQNAVIGNNNTVNQNTIETPQYDVGNGNNILDSFHNDRFNTTIYYPSYWLPHRPPINGDGFSAKDPAGSGEVLFFGCSAFIPGETEIYQEGDWFDYYEDLKVDEGLILDEKSETAFYIHEQGNKISINAAKMIYHSKSRFFIKKTTILDGQELNLIVSCALADSSKYKGVFSKIINDVAVEQGGVNADL